MAKDKKNSISSALMDAETIRNVIKEESAETIKNLLKESTKEAIREAAEEEEKDEKEYEIEDNEETTEVEDEKTEETPEEKSDEEKSEEGAEATEPEKEEEDGDEKDWSEFDNLKVGENTYNLTGVKDRDTAIKVYELLSDDDEVIVTKDGDKLTLKDNKNDAEYVIDLGTEEHIEEGTIKEDEEKDYDMEIAGLPSPEEFEDEDFEEEEIKIESKKNRKTMKEQKERIFEVELGYTDDYQKEDAIEGLSNEEPAIGMVSADKGTPTGTEKPYGGEVKESEPFDEPIKEGKDKEPEVICDDEETVDETVTNTLRNARGKNKAQLSQFKQGPQGAQEVSKGGKYLGNQNESVDYKALAESIAKKAEAILAENKKLKGAVVKIGKQLEESCVLNVSLGKIVKLVTENAVTQKEKVEIVNRFKNEAKTIDQANALYESIQHGLNKEEGKKTLTLEAKNSDARGSVINENTVYQSKDLENIKGLMNRVMNL